MHNKCFFFFFLIFQCCRRGVRIHFRFLYIFFFFIYYHLIVYIRRTIPVLLQDERKSYICTRNIVATLRKLSKKEREREREKIYETHFPISNIIIPRSTIFIILFVQVDKYFNSKNGTIDIRESLAMV